MGDTLITVVAIFLAAVLMFIFPLMSLAERTDDISQLAVQTSTSELVDNVRTTGELTIDDYEKFLGDLASDGNSYEVEITIQLLNEDDSNKTTQAEPNKIGENSYYAIYTTQVEEQLFDTGRIKMKEGDIITVTVRNTNQTIAQLLRNFIYVITGNDTYQIMGQQTGVVAVNGATSG